MTHASGILGLVVSVTTYRLFVIYIQGTSLCQQMHRQHIEVITLSNVHTLSIENAEIIKITRDIKCV